ncbi:hypothetical protein SAMN05216558_3304 [Pseudomonas vancouverensis]|nr:hypothetical protein SAMN05216558_3304 [Pseudomonas vancouverensis]
MDVNDNAGYQAARVVRASIASVLAPTGDAQPQMHRLVHSDEAAFCQSP